MHRFKTLSALLHLVATIFIFGLCLGNFTVLSDAKPAAPLTEKSEIRNMRIVSIGGTITEILYALGRMLHYLNLIYLALIFIRRSSQMPRGMRKSLQ